VTKKIRRSVQISLGWCEDHSEVIRKLKRDIRLELILNGKEDVLIDCKVQSERKGIAIFKHETMFALQRIVTHFSISEAVNFLQYCKSYQNEHFRWRHDNQHFVYYAFLHLHHQEKIGSEVWKFFQTEANITLMRDVNGSLFNSTSPKRNTIKAAADNMISDLEARFNRFNGRIPVKNYPKSF